MDVKLLRTIKTSLTFFWVTSSNFGDILLAGTMEKDGNEEMVFKNQIYLLKHSNRCNFNKGPLSISF